MFVSVNGLVIGWDWLWAVLYFIGSMLLVLVLPEQGLRSKTARYPFERAHFLAYYRRYTTLEEVFGPCGKPPVAAR